MCKADNLFRAEDATLSRIIERLDRIEKHPSAARGVFSSSSEEGASDQPPDEATGHPSAQSPGSRPHTDAAYSLNNEVFVSEDTEVSNVAPPTPWFGSSLNDPDLSEEDAWKGMGNTSILEMAIKQVQDRRKTGARNAHRIATEGVSIPPELARTWMQSQCWTQPWDFDANRSPRLLCTYVRRAFPNSC